jgi:hypothetical protein
VTSTSTPPAAPRFAPGESPFRAKGNVYLGLFESTNSRCPGGVSAVLERIESDALVAFYKQPFVAAVWYDLLPLLPFSVQAARLAGKPHLPYVKEGARFQARRDMSGVYRFFLKLATARMLVERLPRVFSQYFNFGRSIGHKLEGNRAEIHGRQIPDLLAPWMLAVTEGFVPEVLAAHGAKDIVARLDPFQPDGEVHGVAAVRSRLVLTWS